MEEISRMFEDLINRAVRNSVEESFKDFCGLLSVEELEKLAKKDDEILLKAKLHAKRMEHRGRPRKNEDFKSTTEGYGRVTTIMNLEKVAKIKYIALKETLTLKDIWDECLDIAIRRYESKHGKIVLPKDMEIR